MAPPLEGAEDFFEDRLSFKKDEVRRKAEHLYSSPLKERCPAPVVELCRGLEVLSSVELDGEAPLWTEEVENVASAGMLATELLATELPISE